MSGYFGPKVDKICIQPYGLAVVPIPGSLRYYTRHLHQKPKKQRQLHSIADHCCLDQIAIYRFLETPLAYYVRRESALRALQKGSTFLFHCWGTRVFTSFSPNFWICAENKSLTELLKRQIYEFSSEQLPARANMARCSRAVKAGQMLPQLSAPAVGIGCFDFPEMPSFLGVLSALGVLFWQSCSQSSPRQAFGQ